MDKDYETSVPNYRNMEEKRVVETIETPTAKKLGRLKHAKITRTTLFGNLYWITGVKGNSDDIDDGVQYIEKRYDEKY